MPPLQPVVGRAPLYARDPATGDIYEIGGAGASEVFIGNMDPYSSNANATDELWLDTSTNPPVLKGRVGGVWVVVSSEPPKPEVIVGGTIPAPSEDAVWVTDTTMVPPSPGAPMKALWVYDSSAGASAGWHLVETGGGSEVEVLDTEPDAVNPEWELWVDTAPSIHPVPTDEVWVGPTDPRTTYPGNVSDLWLDTTLVPPILKVWNSEIATPAWVTVGYLPLSGGVMNANAHITMGTGGQIKFPNVTAAKILLYSTNFGLGVDSGTLALFVPSANKIAFRADNYNGGEWGYISAAGLHMIGRHAYTDTDGYGFMMNSGGGIYKKSGSGVTIRKHSGNTMPGIEQNDGSGRKDIIVAGGAQALGGHQNVTFTSHLVMSGSNANNSTHLYVDCESNNNDYHFGVLEARKQNGTTIWKLTGYQNADSQGKMYTNLGTEGVKEIWQTCDYGDGQSSFRVHGPCQSTHFHDNNFLSAVSGTMAPIDTELAGRLIDAVRPITFSRTFDSPAATTLNEPGFVAPEHDPIKTLGFDVIDRTAPLADRLVGPEDGGYNLGGMVAILVAEVQSLRARVAELEGTVA